MAHLRVISSVKIDDHVPNAPSCLRCGNEVDVTTAHWGRVLSHWTHGKREDVRHRVNNGVLYAIPMVTEVSFPKKVTGYCCVECYTLLWNTTSRDASGHLRRAFEHVNREVQQPKGDDFEAARVTKGLYAPHVVKGKGQRKADYYETATHSSNSVVIDEASLPLDPADDRKLQGFDKPDRSDIKIDQTKRKTIVKRGKWKVNPTEYNYTPPKKAESPLPKPRLNKSKLAKQDEAALRRIDAAMANWKSPFADSDNG